MSEPAPSAEVKLRLAKRVNRFKPKLSPKLAMLLPFKAQIKELRARNAAYDDVRLILAEENIQVSLDTVYRFCRRVLGEKPREPKQSRTPKVLPQPVLSSHPASPSVSLPNNAASIQQALQERRERLPGLWGRRKRGPRIADSKNL